MKKLVQINLIGKSVDKSEFHRERIFEGDGIKKFQNKYVTLFFGLCKYAKHLSKSLMTRDYRTGYSIILNTYFSNTLREISNVFHLHISTIYLRFEQLKKTNSRKKFIVDTLQRKSCLS